jgi:hypothetical protein
MVDRALVVLVALDSADTRQIEVAVAGPSALLVAKLHKIAERRGHREGRELDKDALDIYRLLQAMSTETLAAGLRQLLSHSLSADVTGRAIRSLSDLFRTDASPGSLMAARAVGPLDDPRVVAASCAALVARLDAALK